VWNNQPLFIHNYMSVVYMHKVLVTCKMQHNYYTIQTQRQTSIQDYNRFNNETCNASRLTIQESHTGSQMSQDTTLHSNG